jgi:hypothetical protein
MRPHARSPHPRPWGLGLASLLALTLATGAPAGGQQQDEPAPDLTVVAHDQFGYATDMAFRGNLLVAGSGRWDSNADDDSGIYVYNIGNPARPKLMGFANCLAWHADVGIWKNLAFQSHDSTGDNQGCSPGEGKEGVRIFDIRGGTPTSIGFAETIHGSHNLTTVGDTGLVYVSSYNLTNPADVDGVSIVDVAADPVAPPVTFLEFPDADNSPQHEDMRNDSGAVPASPGCHDIGLALDRNLAFCAGITETQIWDITNPRDPVIIDIIYNPGVNIHHGAYPNAEGDILVLNDEWLGASGLNTGCLAPRQPTGALWFYDIEDPRNPRPLSYWAPPEPDPTEDFCTSHFFGTFPDRDWLVTSWYDHGVWVVDFTDPLAPTTVASAEPEGANFWAAYPHRGHLFGTSFAPASFFGTDPANEDAGGLWVFDLEGWGRGS